MDTQPAHSLYSACKDRPLQVVTLIPGYLGDWGRRMALTWEMEVAISQDHTAALQPGWQSKTPSQIKKKRRRRNEVQGWGWWLTSVIPALWDAEVGGSLEVKSLRPAWPTWWNPISTKNTKISWAWWHMPVISATWMAEAGESLEPERQRLQWAEITPLHSSLGNKSKIPSQKIIEVNNNARIKFGFEQDFHVIIKANKRFFLF